MTHDEHAVRLADQIAQSLGHDAALDPAALFHTAGHAAVEGKALGGFHRRLVAAPAQGHVQRLAGHLLALAQGVAAPAHADGQRHVDLALQGADLVQYIEFCRHHFLHVAFLHHRYVAGVAHPLQKTGGAADVGFQHPVDAFQHPGLLRVLQLGQLLGVGVDLDDHIRRTGGFVFRRPLAQIGLVHQVQHGKCLPPGGGRRKDIVFAALVLQHLARGLAALMQVQPAEHLAHRSKQAVLVRQNALAEGGVVPHQGLAAEQRHRQRQRAQAQLGLAVFKALALQHPGKPTAHPPCQQQNSQRHQGRQRDQHPEQPRLQQAHQNGQQRTQHHHPSGEYLQCETGFQIHGPTASFAFGVRPP